MLNSGCCTGFAALGLDFSSGMMLSFSVLTPDIVVTAWGQILVARVQP